MTDIVERLVAAAANRSYVGQPSLWRKNNTIERPVEAEAADEIVRLRGLLDEAREIVRPIAENFDGVTVFTRGFTRRAAAWLEKATADRRNEETEGDVMEKRTPIYRTCQKCGEPIVTPCRYWLVNGEPYHFLCSPAAVIAHHPSRSGAPGPATPLPAQEEGA